MNELLNIQDMIFEIRGQRVMIDRDLAYLYRVPTKALNQAVKRNMRRFPEDFMFRLSDEETIELVTNCDRNITEGRFSCYNERTVPLLQFQKPRRKETEANADFRFLFSS